MFIPFPWVPERLIQDVKAAMLEWSSAQKLLVYLEQDNFHVPVALEKRRLTESELDLVKALVEEARHGLNFGGFVAGRDLTDINGLCFFALDQAEKEAHLIGFLANEKLSEVPPLQSPMLLLPLIALQSEKPELEKIYLPFAHVSKDDLISMAAHTFAPTDEPGSWQARNGPELLTDLLEEVPLDLSTVPGWLEVTIEVEQDVADYVSRLLARYGYQQYIASEAAATENPVSPDAAPAVLRTYLPMVSDWRARVETLGKELNYLHQLRPLKPLRVVGRSPEYLAKLWEKELNLYRVGKNLIITPSRQNYSPKPGEILIEIAPSLEVFPISRNGPHPTTNLSLQLLEEYLEPSLHSRLLDLGTGTGVLAIAAALLGVPTVLALDADPEAVTTARENVARNELESRIKVEVGSLAAVEKNEGPLYAFSKEAQQPPPILAYMLPFDAIIANVIPYFLIALADSLVSALRPGGLLITTGLRQEKADEVSTAFARAGLKLLDQREEDGWVAFVHFIPEDHTEN